MVSFIVETQMLLNIIKIQPDSADLQSVPTIKLTKNNQHKNKKHGNIFIIIR